MKRTLLLMLIAVIVCVFALSIGGCAKKKAGPEGEMGAAAEERAPQPGEPEDAAGPAEPGGRAGGA